MPLYRNVPHHTDNTSPKMCSVRAPTALATPARTSFGQQMCLVTKLISVSPPCCLHWVCLHFLKHLMWQIAVRSSTSGPVSWRAGRHSEGVIGLRRFSWVSTYFLTTLFASLPPNTATHTHAGSITGVGMGIFNWVQRWVGFAEGVSICGLGSCGHFSQKYVDLSKNRTFKLIQYASRLVFCCFKGNELKAGRSVVVFIFEMPWLTLPNPHVQPIHAIRQAKSTAV